MCRIPDEWRWHFAVLLLLVLESLPRGCEVGVGTRSPSSVKELWIARFHVPLENLTMVFNRSIDFQTRQFFYSVIIWVQYQWTASIAIFHNICVNCLIKHLIMFNCYVTTVIMLICKKKSIQGFGGLNLKIVSILMYESEILYKWDLI